MFLTLWFWFPADFKLRLKVFVVSRRCLDPFPSATLGVPFWKPYSTSSIQPKVPLEYLKRLMI